MKNLILVYLLLLLSSHSFSQTNNPPLTSKNGFFGWQFKKGEGKLKPGEVAAILQTNPEAARLFSAGRSSYTITSIIGSIGGAMLGYTLGTSVGGGDPNWTVGGIGAGLVAVSLPISISATSKVKKAIGLYNEGPKTVSMHKPEWQLTFTGNKLGVVYRF